MEIKQDSLAPNTFYDLDKSDEYDFTAPSFFRIIYDPYQGFIFRQTLQRSKEEYKQNENLIGIGSNSWIIADENFNKVGESIVSLRDYDSFFVFVNQEGLHIPNMKKYKENDNQITFGVFKAVPK